MARIRSIKPEIAQDAKLATLSRDTRYHFVLLWTVADDEGYFRASPRLLLGQLYPHDPDVDEARITEMNASLARIGLVDVRASIDGPIGCLVNWSKHQKIDRPSKSHLRETFASLSRLPRETFDAGVLSPESRVLSPESTSPAAAVVPKSAVGWPARLAEVWGEQVGPVKEGRVGAALKSAVDRHGVERVERAMRAYIAVRKSEGKPCNVKWFADESQVWVERTASPVDAIDGEMSPTLELLSRPAKVSA